MIGQNVCDVQSFLGFANFYRHFIHAYVDITVPLVHLTRKSVAWNFNGDCWEAFQKLNNAFTTALVLSHWDPEAQAVMETNASDYAISTILSVVHSDGEVHPVAFYSCLLHAAELNYDTHNKELLAVFTTFTAWRHYLEGLLHPMCVITDHKNLEYFSSTHMLTHHQAQWSEFLSPFNFILQFHPGKLGTKPDALT